MVAKRLTTIHNEGAAMISDHADKAARDIAAKLSMLSEEQRADVRKIIEEAILASVHDAVQQCRDAATTACAKDSAMMQQINDEIKRAETALIANLSGMR